MTDLQKIQLRRSEVRSRVSELSAIEAPTIEQTTEMVTLNAEYQGLEVREQSAIIAGDGSTEPVVTEDGEGAELRSPFVAVPTSAHTCRHRWSVGQS